MIETNRLLDTFLRYVCIDSETGFESDVAEHLAQELKELNFEIVADKAGEAAGSQGGNIIAHLNGSISGEPLVLFAHMDTVVPGRSVKPQVENGIVKSDGTTVLGGDDKAAVAAMLEAVRCVVENALPHRTVQLVFTVREESGLLGARGLDLGCLKSKQALILDAGGAVGTVVLAAPGRGVIKAEIIGRKAHAGMAPQEGISAVQAAARGVAAMKLLRIDEETTANIGTFCCEGPINIVPDRVIIKGEARSINPEKLDAQLADMHRCLQAACDETGARLTCETEVEHVGYRVDPLEPVVKLVAAACDELKFPVSYTVTGGCSDANVLREHGISALVLGIGMEEVHTTREWISVKNLQDTAALILHLLTRTV